MLVTRCVPHHACRLPPGTFWVNRPPADCVFGVRCPAPKERREYGRGRQPWLYYTSSRRSWVPPSSEAWGCGMWLELPLETSLCFQPGGRQSCSPGRQAWESGAPFFPFSSPGRGDTRGLLSPLPGLAHEGGEPADPGLTAWDAILSPYGLNMRRHHLCNTTRASAPGIGVPGQMLWAPSGPNNQQHLGTWNWVIQVAQVCNLCGNNP